MKQPLQQIGRIAEFAVLFFGVPLLVRFAPDISKATGRFIYLPVLPVLLVGGALAYIVLRKTTDFEPRDIVSVARTTRRDWFMMLAQFAFFAALLTVMLLLWNPDALFALPRTYPTTWVAVIILYPLVSVTPQGLIYRVLYEKRFAPMFPQTIRWLVGAIVFSFAHIAFANHVALAFTFIGGLIFVSSYKRTGSMFFSNVEHALYGDLIFTLGWGSFFFHSGTLEILYNS